MLYKIYESCIIGSSWAAKVFLLQASQSSFTWLKILEYLKDEDRCAGWQAPAYKLVVVEIL